ncbi:MAG: glycosyltransferase family 4 protein [Bacilli bacterium]|jgi:1,2-diacylglycerol-3-alpha-glucose alpha-1,2-glucosyltransferase|nr:glycosyltransferase family 4 protein [Bacilli bacterium]
MKVLLYLQDKKALGKSGIGNALAHQAQALTSAGVCYTFDPKDTYDIAHINSYQPQTYHFLKSLKKRGIKVIVHGHSTHRDFEDSFRLWKLMAPVYGSWMDKMYRAADMIITPSPYSKGQISQIKGVKCPIKAISNGIDLKAYAPNEQYVKDFEEKFGIKEGEKIVIGAGFYFKRKGIDDFIEVAKRFPDVKFIWFGHLARILTQPYILKCIKNKPSNVILPGYISGNIIKGAYQRASAMLFPTHDENEGIVVLEALASHLPLVVGEAPVYDNWLTSGWDCLKAHDVEGYAKAIQTCLSRDMSSIVEEGYKRAEEVSIEIVGQKLKEAYTELLETKA